jgi:hypothetical protein
MYSNRLNAENAVGNLKRAGFPNTGISVLFTHGTNDFAPGAERSPVTVATMGGTFASLAGIGVISIAGEGPFIAAGPIISLSASHDAGEPIRGLSGVLTVVGMPVDDAGQYAAKLQSGGVLLAVHCDYVEDAQRGGSILKETGAEEIALSAGSPARVRRVRSAGSS